MKIILKEVDRMELEPDEIKTLSKTMHILYKIAEDVDNISEILTPGYSDIGNSAWEAAEKIERFLSDMCVKDEEMI